jgi:hypothetical protein
MIPSLASVIRNILLKGYEINFRPTLFPFDSYIVLSARNDKPITQRYFEQEPICIIGDLNKYEENLNHTLRLLEKRLDERMAKKENK